MTGSTVYGMKNGNNLNYCYLNLLYILLKNCFINDQMDVRCFPERQSGTDSAVCYVTKKGLARLLCSN